MSEWIRANEYVRLTNWMNDLLNDCLSVLLNEWMNEMILAGISV